MDTEYDDDTFYAEIRRQILLLLTSEDNEDLLERKRFNPQVSVGNCGSIRSVYKRASSPASKFCSWETNSSGSTPDWLVNLWKNGKGTGVFIPQAVTGLNNQRSGKMNSRRKTYRPVVNKY